MKNRFILIIDFSYQSHFFDINKDE